METTVELSNKQEAAVRGYHKEIGRSWKIAIEEIFKVGKLLKQAKNDSKLSDASYRELLRRLQFGERVAERLIQVAECKLFEDPKIRSSLPACWTSLYELTQIKKPLLLRAIKSGVLSPEATREDIRRFKCGNADPAPSSRVSRRASAESAIENSDYAQLVVRVPSAPNLEHTLIDLHFVARILESVFSSSREAGGVSIELKGNVKLTNGQRRTSARLSEILRKVHNHTHPHHVSQKTMLDIMGIDDMGAKNTLSFMERFIIAYARREGIGLSPSIFQYVELNERDGRELSKVVLEDVDDAIRSS
jgi:hypothetical protein